MRSSSASTVVASPWPARPRTRIRMMDGATTTVSAPPSIVTF